MTPSECKEAIQGEYQSLLTAANKGHMNKSAIFGIIAQRCKEAARHNGLDDWRYYLPQQLQDES